MSKASLILNEVVGDWLGSPPPIYYKLQKAMQDPEVSFGDFSDIISADPNLASRLLRIANSPFYGLDTKVETITHALSVVGIDQVTDLALATVLVIQFKGISEDLVNMHSFWMHSVGCGLAAKTIAKNLEERQSEPFYLSGMLHDIGSLIIYQEIPEKAQEIISRCQSENLPLDQVEEEVLGFTHSQVAAVIFKKWGLAPGLIEAVQHHHHPSKAREYPLYPAVVHLADIIAYEMDLGSGGEPGVPHLDQGAVRRVGLNRQFLTDIQDYVRDQVEETVSIFYD
ncbi:MAG: HDOD domain-containing protein [Nitrospinaceae bacterium]|nr:HDOD domain-containing protein [Nitrospinaceae bacterium]NIR56175.1 HDOD domain-containing protein [Nitrospinaceae bacterium]NIS86631.1 HDOD domain-containing protein [Nitrospinaceae bacterium]NIT83464.1 HDOD domain-containing protein [Nitrospinaceae bacterium]NIU45669.1 HDOD domain-containing protein [Nitrospinaceae bacterium]